MNPALAHAHDIQGRRKSARREDGTIWTYEYNTRSEVTGAEKRQSNSDLVPGLDFGYNYDGLGNRLNASKGQPTLVTTYTPDAMNRYSTIESPGADDILVRSATAVEVEVDEEPVAVTTSGNFRSARVTANNTTGPAFPELSITGDNDFSESGHRWVPQAEFSPQYDDDGNLTNDGRWIYTWDAMNRLVGMTPTTAALTAGVPNQTLTFAYDHLGRRIAKKVTTANGQGTTIKDYRYLYEGWNVVAQFTADTNNTLTPDATYLWSLDLSGTFHGAGGVGGLHSVNLYSGGAADTPCLAIYDANGNIIAWTEATGKLLQRQDYDPFGNRVIRERVAITSEQSERLEYGFSTKPLDAETGLIYYIHRYYGPRHGQWLSQDPIEESGGLNLYGFVGNDGNNRVDYLGLDTLLLILGEEYESNSDVFSRSADYFENLFKRGGKYDPRCDAVVRVDLTGKKGDAAGTFFKAFKEVKAIRYAYYIGHGNLANLHLTKETVEGANLGIVDVDWKNSTVSDPFRYYAESLFKIPKENLTQNAYVGLIACHAGSGFGPALAAHLKKPVQATCASVNFDEQARPFVRWPRQLLHGGFRFQGGKPDSDAPRDQCWGEDEARAAGY